MVNFSFDPPVAPMSLKFRVLTLRESKLSVNIKLKRSCFMCSHVSCHQHIITLQKKSLSRYWLLLPISRFIGSKVIDHGQILAIIMPWGQINLYQLNMSQYNYAPLMHIFFLNHIEFSTKSWNMRATTEGGSCEELCQEHLCQYEIKPTLSSSCWQNWGSPSKI